jgi:hypothetical protein
MSKKNGIGLGEALGLGLTGIFTVGSISAVIHACRRDESDRDKLERCKQYYNGSIPGYDTQPGNPYLVLTEADDQIIPVCEIASIWFDTSSDEARFVYDLCKKSGDLPPLGALLATAHHRKSGSHFIGKKGPMRGFNLWGQRAARKWRSAGNPFFIPWDQDATFRASRTTTGPFYKFFDTPEDSVRDWLYSVLSAWPRARDQLKRKDPNPYEYTWYLQGEHSPHGRDYAGTLKQEGGSWIMGSALIAKLKDTAEDLAVVGYNGLLDWAMDLPEFTHEQCLRLAELYPDRSAPFPLGDEEYP